MEIKDNQVVRSKEDHMLNCLATGIASQIAAKHFNVDTKTVNTEIYRRAQEQLELIKTKPGLIDELINRQINEQKSSLGKFAIELDVKDL